MQGLLGFFDLDDEREPLRARAGRAIHWLVERHERLEFAWADGAPGWAPEVATELLQRSRLDRNAQLARCLRMWLDVPPADRNEAYLILAWANLGSLVEGTLKLFLSVFAHDYANNPVPRRNRDLGPDELMFERLRQFFRDRVWLPHDGHWDAWLEAIQRRRNTVHSYRDSDVGTHDEFLAAILGCLRLTAELHERLPAPPVG